ncbi:MAG TPA: hypothetical protein VGL61_27875 [Kofleriaceae bacterium]
MGPRRALRRGRGAARVRQPRDHESRDHRRHRRAVAGSCSPSPSSPAVDRPIALESGVRFAVREGGRTIGAGVVTAVT